MLRAVLVVGLLVAGFAAGRLLPSRHGPAAGADARRVLHYACPMHPTVRSDQPGTAPCCGMALEPVHDGGGGPARTVAGAVTLGAELRRLQGIRLGAAERRGGVQTLRLLGRVAPDDARVHVVEPAVEGTAREVSGATVGSFVRRGDKLGTFFSAEIRSSLQSYLSVLDAVEGDEAARRTAGLPAQPVAPGSSASFAAERLRTMGVSEGQIQEMRRTRQLPLTVQLRAPVDGVVVGRDFLPGQRIGPGMECFRIANVDRVWVLADVSDADAAIVRPGAKARVAARGREPLEGVVSDDPPRFDPTSRAFKVRLEVANPHAELRPDMFVDVEVDVAHGEAVTVPAEAVLDAGLHKTVFVQTGEATFEPRQVETGWRAGGRVEIRRGLAPGERIVVSGTFMVDSESQLRAAAAPAAAARTATATATATEDAALDPVCGMTVDPAEAEAAGRTHVHGDRTYHFCSEGCRDTFAGGPARFARRADHAPGAR